MGRALGRPSDVVWHGVRRLRDLRLDVAVTKTIPGAISWPFGNVTVSLVMRSHDDEKMSCDRHQTPDGPISLTAILCWQSEKGRELLVGHPYKKTYIDKTAKIRDLAYYTKKVSLL
jgi:hypothetical protein